jgi:hypothetical protein
VSASFKYGGQKQCTTIDWISEQNVYYAPLWMIGIVLSPFPDCSEVIHLIHRHPYAYMDASTLIFATFFQHRRIYGVMRGRFAT